MSDPLEAVEAKVKAIFEEIAGQRASKLAGYKCFEPAREIFARALEAEHGASNAAKLALHMTDWTSDAAFIVAANLYPERFSAEEINAGIGLFLCHAPNHIRAACQITGDYAWENFPEEDESV